MLIPRAPRSAHSLRRRVWSRKSPVELVEAVDRTAPSPVAMELTVGARRTAPSSFVQRGRRPERVLSGAVGGLGAVRVEMVYVRPTSACARSGRGYVDEKGIFVT